MRWIWCYGLMTTRLEPVIQEAVALAAETDDKIHYLALTPIALAQGEVGTCGHPNVRAHRRAAAALIQKISEITGWYFFAAASGHFICLTQIGRNSDRNRHFPSSDRI